MKTFTMHEPTHPTASLSKIPETRMKQFLPTRQWQRHASHGNNLEAEAGEGWRVMSCGGAPGIGLQLPNKDHWTDQLQARAYESPTTTISDA